MSEPENAANTFLERWSRRKQATQTRAPDDAVAAIPQRTEPEANAPERAAAKAEPDLPAFDLEMLPPIESINAASDVRAFLAPGVPEELTRAALRRAWATDPAIRDFIGIAENQWDFTNPGSIPGFGPLEFTDDIRRMVEALVGGPPEQPDASPSAATNKSDQIADKPGEMAAWENAAESGPENSEANRLPGRESGATGEPRAEPQVEPPFSVGDTAGQQSLATGSEPHGAHRRHGGAVPK